ncbi:MAG: phenylacetyl-CoA:acceptor oxidoreductase [Actinomycetota bacterium]
MRQMTTARLQRYWDLRAAGNFIGGGTGTGLVLASAVAMLMGRDATIPLAVGLAFVGLGLSLVWLEIGKPWRALHVFFHPQTSWMTREGILAAPLMAAGAGAVLLGSPVLHLLAAMLAGGFLYCQARILKASRAIPAWSHRRTVPLILVTGLAEGTGVFLVLADPNPAMVALALAAAVVREAAREGYRKGLIRDRAPKGTLDWFVRPEVRVLQALRVAALALLAAGLAGFGWAAVAGGALAAVTGWALKAIMVTRAAFTRGAAIPRTPTRGRSTSRTVEA